jgi:hypothetical protein
MNVRSTPWAHRFRRARDVPGTLRNASGGGLCTRRKGEFPDRRVEAILPAKKTELLGRPR